MPTQSLAKEINPLSSFTVPKTMSTQHPDNVTMPFFVENSLLGGEDEIQEAFYAYSHLGCHEQMWDFEGKEVDTFVVKKLLTKNEAFFKENKLGRDVRLTLRVPNPDVEKAEAKILLETLESIPRSYDAAKLFYGEDIAPIFEVILPMATNARSIDRIYCYYRDVVAGKSRRMLKDNDITIGEWIGEFKPERINLIPLFEDREHMLGSADILREYLKDKELGYQRVFLARSDPAVNYGNIGAVLLNKIALQRLYKLSEEINVPILPIIGVGSAPFRGNLRPQTVDGVLSGYPSAQTFSIQSSFKFDNSPEIVREAIAKINNHEIKTPVEIDEQKAIQIIDKYSKCYIEQLKKLGPIINKVAAHVPKRRKRKLHIGLFGYSRSAGEITLPRAIKLTASCYSLGVPPELLGLDALTDDDISFVKSVYSNLENDLRDAYKFANLDSPFMPATLKNKLNQFFSYTNTDTEHAELTSLICKAVNDNSNEDLSDPILRAAHLRGFLG